MVNFRKNLIWEGIKESARLAIDAAEIIAAGALILWVFLSLFAWPSPVCRVHWPVQRRWTSVYGPCWLIGLWLTIIALSVVAGAIVTCPFVSPNDDAQVETVVNYVLLAG